ncbi:hypothetical protein ABW12_06830 [Pluralibacter gergoviae]|nr:hypothetical protein ABW12_06830 [Pluralibacter gergoviae]
MKIFIINIIMVLIFHYNCYFRRGIFIIITWKIETVYYNSSRFVAHHPRKSATKNRKIFLFYIGLQI